MMMSDEEYRRPEDFKDITRSESGTQAYSIFGRPYYRSSLCYTATVSRLSVVRRPSSVRL